MPLSEIKFVTRGNNNLLEGILNRQTVSLSDALNDAVQLTRDANNLQAGQERTALSEIRFDRSFREGQFRDRRDFDRRTFTEDRTFGENVRQFNALDADRDADRGLRAELGRGNLALAGRRTALAEREGKSRIATNDLRRRNEETIFNLRAAAAAGDLPQRSAEEQETLRRGGQAFNLPGVVSAVDGSGILPPKPDAAASSELSTIAALRLEDGDLDEAEVRATEAVAVAPENSREHARAVSVLTISRERKREAAALQDAQNKLEGKGAAISQKALQLFNDNKNTSFNPASTFEREAESALTAKTRDAYIRAGEDQAVKDPRTGRVGKLTPSQKDARAKKRGEFYDSVRATSSNQRRRASQTQDPYGTYFR